jgi:hypothetical protein
MKNILLILPAILFSCEKNDCQKKCDPTWIEEATQTITQNGYKGEIFKYVYQNQEVYLVKGCLECADFVDVVRNCEGKIICKFGGIMGKNTCPDFDKATMIEIVWKN